MELNLKGYKGRELRIGQPVRVYRNLNNQMFSVIARTGDHKGLVVLHTVERQYHNIAGLTCSITL